MSTAAERFAEWSLALRLADVPDEVLAAAKRHLLDGFGCALAAVRTDAAAPALAVARALGGDPESAIIGGAERVSAPAAALANGTLVHALDYDDTHAAALVHATAAVLPSAFAVGEQTEASGHDVLAAAIVGYEIVARLGAAVTHGFHARGFHATSVCGGFASAAVASKLYGLDAGRLVNALGIAGSMAAGSLEFLRTGSSTKQLHPGIAAMNGIVAARLAAAGAGGPSTIFEGEHGLFRTYTDSAVDADALTGDLGTRWETAAITIKPYPACQLVHASLDAFRAILPLEAAAIESITVAVTPAIRAIVCEPEDAKRRPRTAYEGKFSLPYCIATLAIDGSLGIEAFDPDRLARADVLDLAARVRWEDGDRDGPPADAPGNVVVRTKDGRILSGHVERSNGGPGSPLTDDQLFEKFASNAGTDGARALADAILSLDRSASLEAVLRAPHVVPS